MSEWREKLHMFVSSLSTIRYLLTKYNQIIKIQQIGMGLIY